MRIRIAVCVIALSMPLLAAADQHEGSGDIYTYGTYFYCEPAGEDAVDAIFAKEAEVIDKAVADGAIMGWGWYAHHTGGQWRRLRYHQSDSVSGALEGLRVINERMEAAGVDSEDKFSDICNSHDDYIWKTEAGSPGAAGGASAKAGLSTYIVCDFTGEERADEIVKTVFAPVYDKAVADGKLTSWGWLSHVLGGKYRRVATMTAADFDTLLKTRAEIIETIYGDGGTEAGKEFSSICGSHADYLWEIRHQKGGS